MAWFRAAAKGATAAKAAKPYIGSYAVNQWKQAGEAVVHGGAETGKAAGKITGGILGGAGKVASAVIGVAAKPVKWAGKLAGTRGGKYVLGFGLVAAATAGIAVFLGRSRHHNRAERDAIEADKVQAIANARNAGFNDEMARFQSDVINPNARTDNAQRLLATREAAAAASQQPGGGRGA